MGLETSTPLNRAMFALHTFADTKRQAVAVDGFGEAAPMTLMVWKDDRIVRVGINLEERWVPEVRRNNLILAAYYARHRFGATALTLCGEIWGTPGDVLPPTSADFIAGSAVEGVCAVHAEGADYAAFAQRFTYVPPRRIMLGMPMQLFGAFEADHIGKALVGALGSAPDAVTSAPHVTFRKIG